MSSCTFKKTDSSQSWVEFILWHMLACKEITYKHSLKVRTSIKAQGLIHLHVKNYQILLKKKKNLTIHHCMPFWWICSAHGSLIWSSHLSSPRQGPAEDGECGGPRKQEKHYLWVPRWQLVSWSMQRMLCTLANKSIPPLAWLSITKKFNLLNTQLFRGLNCWETSSLTQARPG